MNRSLSLPALTLVLATSLAACLQNPSSCESNGPTDFQGSTLKVVDNGAFDYMFPVIEPLFENLTGADLIQIKSQDTGEALRRAIESKGNPFADVIYGIDQVLFPTAAAADILEPYDSPRLTDIVLPSNILGDFRQAGMVRATPADHGFVSVNYDIRLKDSFSEAELPRTLVDLATARWAGQFVIPDPRLSPPGLGFLIASVATFGENDDYDYLDYWGELYDHGVLIVPDWSQAYLVHFSAGYGQYEEGFVGDRKIVVSYTSSPAYEAYFSQGPPPSVSLEPARGVFHQVETVAILRCTHQLPLARAFVDFVLGDAFQSEAMANLATYPVTKTATVPQAFHDHATEPDDLQPVLFTTAQLAEGIPRWVAAWTDLHHVRAA